MRMSPGVPLPAAGSPWPRMRIFLPSSMPAGIFTISVSVLPDGRWTLSCTSPPMIEVLKGISSSWAMSAPRRREAPRSRGGAAEMAEEVAQAARPLAAEPLAEELAEIDVLGGEAARSRRGIPRRRAPAPTARLERRRRPWSQTTRRSGRTFPAFPGCSARRRPAGSSGTSSWPTCRPGSCRDGASAPARDRPCECRPARRCGEPPGSCNSLLPCLRTVLTGIVRFRSPSYQAGFATGQREDDMLELFTRQKRSGFLAAK